ncbi:MAG TPA: PAS domain-containing hybrid sensor histidine kinase/response regulator, partial [Candidatus Hydrogenedentes bacterium]|nr:PAS domain-containing hybrid sensor histidine kinase/response regulator [Candidatus Hydrogenedentota bacterium]
IACMNIASHSLDHMPVFARQVLETLAGQIGQAIAREQAETLRIEREANLNTLFNTIKDMLFVMDKQGRILRVNPAVVKTLGYTEDQMRGAPLLNVHPPAQREEAARLLVEIISGRRATYNIPAITKEGREIPIETSLASGRWNGHVAFFGVARDISARVEAEERRLSLERQVQHAQRFESLGILAGGIAHDFNNLLMIILGYVELMQYRLDDKAFSSESLGKIQRTARNASALCKQMLAYSGRGALIKETVCLNSLILDMDHLFQASISKKIALKIDLDSALPYIAGDPAQLQQVLMNLVFNASEAIGEGEGSITIATRASQCTEEEDRELKPNEGDARCILLEVADTGCGMDAETLERVYDPFFSTKFTGRGLGMSAVLGIVRGLKGSIKAESAPGQGTTFRIRLPRAHESAPPKVPAPEKQPTPVKGAGTILIVEDEEDLREMGKMTGEYLGFRMLSAADGCEAVDVYRRESDSIDLVLLDMTMPRMDGEQTFYEMKRLNPNVRVIITSGYANQEIEKRFAGKGLIGVLQKPYSMSALEEKIQLALKHTG